MDVEDGKEHQNIYILPIHNKYYKLGGTIHENNN